MRCMFKYLRIELTHLLLLIVCMMPFIGKSENIISLFPKDCVVPDSILGKVYSSASMYSNEVKGFKANLYLKGVVTVHHRNRIIKYIPSMFKLEDSISNYMHESISELQYTAPSIYDRKIKAMVSTFKSQKGHVFDIMDYIKFNIYSSSLMGDKVMSPLNNQSKIHYKYILDSRTVIDNKNCYKIRVQPRYKSTKLVEGYIWLYADDWSVYSFDFSGEYDLVDFRIKAFMGNTPQTKYLPCYMDLDMHFRFLKNHLQMRYSGWLDYTEVKFAEQGEVMRLKKDRNKYNLSSSYTLTCDTSRLVTDIDSFSRMRPFPLTDEEELMYKDKIERRIEDRQKQIQDSIDNLSKPKSQVFLGQVGDALINSYDIDLPKVGSINCSPIINPLLLSYSHRNGISYRQSYKYNNLFYDGRLLRIAPQIGFNFTKKELYAKVDAEYVYNPRKHGAVELHVGNGNRIYSSVVLDQLEAMPDSTFSFDGLNLDYFKDIYVNLSHNIEILNGFSLWTGLSMHWRYTKSTPELDARVRSRYNSFAPRLRVEWTPGMYYYMNGNRKVNVGSYYPTFIADYERGIRVFKSSGGYERLELSAEQVIKVRNIHHIAYHIGCGFFLNQEDMYFVDYINFSNRNLPQGWNDDIGGTFQMLDSRWYNASSHYVGGNMTYESPFILLYPVSKLLSFIQKERIYAGILFMPHLNPYFEVGYGIGTHIFDAGIFVGNERGKFTSIGCKFTFELFNK
ncbi:DUF5686 family protein [Bacteroides sp.]|uniref:DUF5686 family protein n=1 Tax=Bacteroides sp. TaxID=29523 RepID=UPI0025C040A0|nr:DUF5686 family protein [Bacteroides sp.]